MTDFITTDLGGSPTEGLEEKAPDLPYVPSRPSDLLDPQVMFGDANWLIDQAQNNAAKYGIQDGNGDPIVQPEERLSPDQLKAQFPGVKGLDQPLPLTVARNMAREQAANARRADIAARYPSGVGNAVEAFGAGAVAGLLDPVDDAAFMIPVVGEARYAQWLARAGETAGWLGRAGVVAGVGAARGAVGGGVIAGGRYLLGDPDMTLGRVAEDTLDAAAGGAILHTVFGAGHDILGERFATSPEGQAAARNINTSDAAVRTAAAQMADGQPIEVRPVFDAASRSRADLMSSTALDRVYPQSLDDAVARAAGRPSEETIRLEDAAAEAKANPPDRVMEAQTSEAERAIEALRQEGRLTPADEAELDFHAAEAPKGWGAVEPDEAPQGEQTQLSKSVTATLPENVSENEARVVQAVQGLLQRIAPGAEAMPAARLDVKGEPGALGLGQPTSISGYTAVNGARQVIAWSLESANAEATARHEAVHFLRHTGLIQPGEWETLAKAATYKGWLQTFNIAERYPKASAELQTEEAVASAYGKWRQTPGWVPRAIAPIFDRIRGALDQVSDFVRRTFGMDATADDIFSRISSGEVGARASATPAGEFGAAEAPTPEQMDEAVRARKRLTAMQDLLKRHALASKVEQIRSAGLSLAHGIDALTRGISENVPGARDSTAQAQLARQNELLGRFVANLEKVPGATTAWQKRTATADWVRELAELNKAQGEPGITKNPLALKIAKGVHDAQDLARLRLNQSGAWVGDYDGYVARTQHDPIKIHNAGYEQWNADTLSGLDQAKTFGDLDLGAREEFMRNTWDALSTGIHMSSDHGVSPKAGVFQGPGSMARRASQERVLHWKDADAWRAYQQKYGDPDIERGVMASLTRAGRDAALMERWGSNPQFTFENLIRQVRETYRSDHDAIRKLDAALPRIREEFAHLTGEASRPQKALETQIRGSIIALQDITKLGNVLLAHLSTAVTKPFQMQYLGIGRWQAYTSVLRNLMQDTSPEGRTILENLRANATGQFQDLMGGYEAVDGIPGQIAKLRQMSMRIGGLPWMLGRQKAGTMWEVANFLGQQLDKTFEQLDGRTQRGLSIYGITPADWEALRSAPDHDRDVSGSVYLTPAAALRATVDDLAGDRLATAVDSDHFDRIIGETRDKLSMKLAAYYADAADRSTISPGIQERAFWTRRAGRVWGPALGQYKSWAMAAVRTMWGQAIYGSTRGEAVKSLAELVAVGTAIGYARLAITSALNGMTPATFNDDWKHNASLMTKSMVAGGGLGVWGDYLLGEYSKAGANATDRAKDLAMNVLGPAFSDAATVYGLGKEVASIPFADSTDQAIHRAEADGMKTLTDHLPFVNTFYLRLLSRWLFVDRLNEMANPGYLQRHQDAVKERTGQDFWLPPNSYLGAAQ